MKLIRLMGPIVLILLFLAVFFLRSKPDSQTPAVLQFNQTNTIANSETKTADLTTSFNTTDKTTATEVKVKNKDYQISFSKDSQNSTVEKSDETRYSRLPNGVKEEIILSKAPAAPFIAKYTATLSGVKPRFFQNLWHFFDKDGKEQFFIPKPFMIDQKGQRSENINLQISPISANQYQITLTPDHSWLTSPDRTYPVIVDPTIEIPNQPIQEIIAKRNQTSKTYSLPNGRFAWEGSIGPVHYKDNPNNSAELWKDIDLNVQPANSQSGYDFQNLTNNFKSYFKKNSTNPATVKYENNGHYITFTNQDNELGQLKSVEGSAQNNQFIYPEAYDNIDIKYSIGASELLEEFVLKGPRDVSKISQKVHFEDAYYQEQKDGSIKFFSTKTNELVWIFPKPKMYELNERKDENGLPSKFENFGLHYEIIKDGNDYIVTKVLDQEGKDWLNSSERVYPLVIDTTLDLQVGASTDDGQRQGGAGFTTTDVSIQIGKNYSIISHLFARWTGVTIAGTIDVAYIQLWDQYYGDASVLMKVYGIDEDNPAAPTTYGQFDADPLTTAAVDWDGALTVGAWNQSPSLKTIFQELVDTYTISNEAVMIQVRDDGSPSSGLYVNQVESYDFSGNVKGPKLHIEYTVPTMQFNGLKMQGIQIR